MDRAAIIAKIAKCLALSQSANEHEAAVALAKARELMAEHNIGQVDVDLADVVEAGARASGNLVPPRWEAILSKSVCRALGCQSFLDEKGHRRFVGFDPVPEIAAYAFAVLFRQLKRARADHIQARLRRCRPATKRSRADAFCEGWACAVFNKVAELKPSEAQHEKTARYLAVRYPGLVKIGSRSAAGDNMSAAQARDFHRGATHGSAVEISRGVAGAGCAPLPIEAR